MPTASAVQQEVKDGLAEFKSSVLEAMPLATAVQEVKSSIDDVKATLAAAPTAASAAEIASSLEEFKSSFLTTVPTHSAVQEIKDGVDVVKDILGATPMAISAAVEVKTSLEKFRSSFPIDPKTLSLRSDYKTIAEDVHHVKAAVAAVQVDTQAIRQSLQAPPRSSSGLRRAGSNTTITLPQVVPESPQR